MEKLNPNVVALTTGVTASIISIGASSDAPLPEATTFHLKSPELKGEKSDAVLMVKPSINQAEMYVSEPCTSWNARSGLLSPSKSAEVTTLQPAWVLLTGGKASCN